MNYRHSFHAGNVADVFKHLVLTLVLEALRAKDKPFCVIDTHAGSGLYSLTAPGEFEQGIARLWPVRADWPVFNTYFSAVATCNGQGLERYPGSPRIIANQLRPGDRAIFIERHPEEVARLRALLGTNPAVAIQDTDGFAVLPALVPPRENRGLVLIDPPYEQVDEIEHVAQALRAAVKRWRNGIYMVWYPIKVRRTVECLLADLRGLVPEAYAVELLTLPEEVAQRLNGSGVAILNPPWALRRTLEENLPALAALLAPAGGRPRVGFIDLGANTERTQ